MRARILVCHRHESREHGELEIRVDGAILVTLAECSQLERYVESHCAYSPSRIPRP